MLKQGIERLGASIASSSDIHVKVKSLGMNWMRRYSESNKNGMPREKVDCLVIGAGVVGLAVARALAIKGRDVLVVESASAFGTATSSRNSEVIHAGIYYPRNSFKVNITIYLLSLCSANGFSVSLSS